MQKKKKRKTTVKLGRVDKEQDNRWLKKKRLHSDRSR